jgi:hypothetical protein
MSKYPWSVLVRFAAFIAPLFLLYLYAQYAFDHAREQERHGDTGLGIAILLGLICFVLFTCFFVDFVIQVRKKRILNFLADVFILVILLMPFGWFACNWFGGRDRLICKVPIDTFNQFLSLLNL